MENSVLHFSKILSFLLFSLSFFCPDLMEIVQEQRHECKVCKKRFISGRSLGGHMRCHIVTNRALSDKNPIESDIGFEEDGGGKTTGYSLRKNPRKRSQRYKIASNPSSSNFSDSSSATLTLSEPELEEGVMCLMLLSRADRRSWEESNSVYEFSDNNSAIPEPKPSHQTTPIVKDDEDENFVSKGYDGETSKMLLIEKGMQRSESSGQEYGGNVLFEKKTTESHHESTEKIFQSEIKINSTTIDSDLGDIDVRSIGLEEASSESQKHNSSKRAKCEPYEADSEDKKRGCATRNNKRIYKCSSKVFQSRRPRHLALASNSKRCGKSIHTNGKANSKVEEYKEENPIEIEQEAEAAGVSELKRRSKDYECGVCFKVFASGQALGVLESFLKNKTPCPTSDGRGCF